MHVEMFAAYRFGKQAMVDRDSQTLAQLGQRLESALLMHDVARQLVLWGQCLAEVVGEGGEADQVVARRQSRGHVADHFLVHAGVDFRMKFRALRYAVQRIHFRQDRGQCVGVVQAAQEGRRLRQGQCTPQFLPDTLGNQCIQFAAGGDLSHQFSGFRCQGEAQRCEAGHEACRAQHAQRVFDKCRADMAQHALFDIAHAAPGINQLTGGLIAGDGVDGEVATLQIFFQ
ncbi:hypothetical protein D3C71_1445590 [compost metagenome]